MGFVAVRVVVRFCIRERRREVDELLLGKMRLERLRNRRRRYDGFWYFYEGIMYAWKTAVYVFMSVTVGFGLETFLE